MKYIIPKNIVELFKRKSIIGKIVLSYLIVVLLIFFASTVSYYIIKKVLINKEIEYGKKYLEHLGELMD